MAMWTQLIHQLLLQGTQGPGVLLGRWEDLDGAHMQVLPEGEAQDVQVLAAVAEGAGQSDKHWRGGTEARPSGECLQTHSWRPALCARNTSSRFIICKPPLSK